VNNKPTVEQALASVRRRYHSQSPEGVLVAEVDRLRKVTAGDGGRIFALQAEVERLQVIERAAKDVVASTDDGDVDPATVYRLGQLTGDFL
jgi:hypothetical protein